MPLISVIIPVFNGAETIREAVSSIQTQDISDSEIIIVDDGSTDNTAAILKELAADERIRVLTKPNGGIVDALNTGLEQCKGEYIARHDADDIAYNHRFSTQINYLKSHPECVAISNAVRHIDGKGKATGFVAVYSSPDGSNPLWIPSKEPYLIHPFLMVRRTALASAGGYRYVFHAEDTDLYWRLQEIGGLHNLPDVLGDYRVHEGSISSKSVMNGRIASLNAQLAAISTVRRRKGMNDLQFRHDYLKKYQEAGSINKMVALWKDVLTEDELAYLRLSTVSKLLELTTHRPYELEAIDCDEMRGALKHKPSFATKENLTWVNGLVANAGGRLLLKGEYKKAYKLLPPSLYAAACIRFILRKFAPPGIRRTLKRLLGKEVAPSDYSP